LAFPFRFGVAFGAKRGTCGGTCRNPSIALSVFLRRNVEEVQIKASYEI
jgi:hypothetical protein